MSSPLREPLPFGRFVLLELLGRGGMAEVWRARLETEGFTRTVVVKRILPHLAGDPSFAQLFEREARLSARLNHSNIVQVFDSGKIAGEPYLAMELVDGLDLTRALSVLSERGRPPLGLGPYVAREVARALAYAHGLAGDDGRPLGLVHRDVSPSNVLLGSDGAVKLLDFGIAKALFEVAERTQTGGFKGKVGYASPEVAEGGRGDQRADLFALGVVLHESLTGERLFKGESDIATLGLVRAAKVPPPSSLNPKVPPEVDEIVLRALAKNPAERYPTAEAFALALDPVVHALRFERPQLTALVASLRGSAPAPAAETGTLPSAPKKRRRLGPVIALAMVTVAAGAGVALWPSAPPPPPAPIAAPVEAPPETPPVVEKAPEPTPVEKPPEKPTEVLVRIRSTPAGAKVRAPGKKAPLGKTPLEMRWPLGKQPAQLVVERAGYRPISLDVSDMQAQQFDVQLRRTSAPPGPSTATKKVANVKDGEVVDPFAR